MIDYQGQSYFDDRLFILYLCRCRVENGEEGTVETTLFHEASGDDLLWCLATYRNCPKYPVASVNNFESKDDALKYLSIVEPTVPLISLNGQSRNPPLSYEDHLVWKRERGFSDYNYKKVYMPGGTNHKELVVQAQEHFFAAGRRVRETLSR